MPLERSASKEATKRNFHEVRHGKGFKKTARKHGVNKARKQMIARVLENKRRSSR